MTSERDTTINRLLTVVTFHSIRDYDWALSSKIQRLKYAYPLQEILPNRQSGLSIDCNFSSVEIHSTKPCAIGKDLTVFIKEIGVSRYIGNPARFNILQPSYVSSS